MTILFLLAAAVVAAYAAQPSLPEYFKKCSRSDPNLDECFAANGNLAIPTLVKGDKKFRFPVLEPLRIDEISIDPSGTFHMGLKNVTLYGLGKSKITKVNILLDQDRMVLYLTIPKMEIRGEYETRGQILILPIEGTGPALLNFLDGRFVVSIDFGRYTKDGVTYLNVKGSNVTYDLGQATYQFDNLFNGNKQLGDEMNKFINENWRELSGEFRPAVVKTITQVMESILGELMKKTPEADIYDP